MDPVEAGSAFPGLPLTENLQIQMTVTPAATQASRAPGANKACAPRGAAADPLEGLWPEGETRAASLLPLQGAHPQRHPVGAEKEPPATKAAARKARPGLGAPALGPLGGSSLTAVRGQESGGLWRKRKRPRRQRLPLALRTSVPAPGSSAFTLTGAGPQGNARKDGFREGIGPHRFCGADWKPLGVPGTPERRPLALTARPGGRPGPRGLGVWRGLGCAVKMHNVAELPGGPEVLPVLFGAFRRGEALTWVTWDQQLTNGAQGLGSRTD